LAAGLIRIGKEGIATGNDKVLDAYFYDDFVIHAPGGNMNLTQLKTFWASLRHALTGFTITREQIIVESNWVGSRTIFSGTFDKVFTQSPVGTIQPTGKPVKLEVINVFRYTDAGLLAEEWVQYD
jgi:predicted ester cyclase